MFFLSKLPFAWILGHTLFLKSLIQKSLKMHMLKNAQRKVYLIIIFQIIFVLFEIDRILFGLIF